jgi:flagellar motor switch protein FliN/FliY
MTIPFSEVASQLQQKCAAGLAQAALAITEAFGEAWEIEAGNATEWNVDSVPADWNDSGLIFVFQSGKNAALVVLADASHVAPDWCAQPDESGQKKLRKLAQELASAFFPTKNASPECTVGRVKNVRESIIRSAPPANSAFLPLSLRSKDRTAVLWVLWPSAGADAMPMDQPYSISGASEVDAPTASAPTETQKKSREAPRYNNLEEGIGLLPAYSRSLLRIRVPVTVTLAAARQSLETILNIGSGSIIHFNKSCEDTLTLEVAGHKVAVGETVKVGDKFGLWITSMILPDERFWVLSARQQSMRAK